MQRHISFKFNRKSDRKAQLRTRPTFYRHRWDQNNYQSSVPCLSSNRNFRKPGSRMRPRCFYLCIFRYFGVDTQRAFPLQCLKSDRNSGSNRLIFVLFSDFKCSKVPLPCVKRACESINICRFDNQYKLMEKKTRIPVIVPKIGW